MERMTGFVVGAVAVGTPFTRVGAKVDKESENGSNDA